jgi:Undecaprenyl-phosphate glucose phosphotransferase
MIRRRVNLLEWVLTIGHSLVPSLAFALAAYIRFESSLFEKLYPRFWLHRAYEVETEPYSYVGLVILVTVTWALVAEHFDLNRLRTLRQMNTGIWTAAKATASTLAIVLVATFFYRGEAFSRVFVGSATVLMFLMDVGLIQTFRYLAESSRTSPGSRLRLVVVGGDEHAQRIARKLECNTLIGFEVVCFVALPGQKPAIDSQPVVEWERLAEAAEKCDEVILVVPAERLGEIQTYLESVESFSVPARVVLDLGEGMFVPSRIFDLQGVTLLDVRSYAVDTVGYVVAKRVFDVVFSLLALLLIGPLMVLIALAIKFTSPGPALFAQERVGLSGRRFWMLKFRTMQTQEGLASSTQHTARGDPRITRVGSLLRRTSLDELPQFLNVLAGDMSVVGPRPELTYFVQKFRHEIPAYMARHNIKCGITGWAQIHGLRGSDSSIPQRIQYDMNYLRNWSLWLDIKIIVLTVFRGLLSRNAY